MQLLNASRIISQAKPSQAKPSQAKPSQALSFKAWAAPKLALAFAFLAFALTACGGGGGSSPAGTTGGVAASTSPAFSFKCFDTTITSNAAQPSSADCSPLAQSTLAKVSVTVSATNELKVSGLPPSFTAGTVTLGDLVRTRFVYTVVPTGTAGSGLGLATLATAPAGVQLGTMQYASSYAGTAKLSFNDAREANIAFTLVTGFDPTPLAWVSVAKTVVDAGIVNGVVNSTLAVRTWLTLSPAAQYIGGNADWVSNLKSGNVQIVKSGEMAPDASGVQRNIWRAVYAIQQNSILVPFAYCISPIYADTGLSYVNDNRTGVTCLSGQIAYAIGVDNPSNPTSSGMIYRGVGYNTCSLNTATKGDTPIACPF